MKRNPILSAVLSAGLLLPPMVAQAMEAAVVRSAPDRLEIHWSSADPVDVYVSPLPDARPSQAQRVARGDRDGAFTLAWHEARRPYVILRDTRDGAVTRVAERLLPLERGSNFRDVGGYPAAGGKHVRWGLIYRTGATPLLTPDDDRYVGTLGVTSVIDLRSSEERQLAPDQAPAGPGVRYFAHDYPASDIFSKLPPNATPATSRANQSSLYRGWLVSLAPQYRDLFRQLLKGQGPVSYHCSAGQDRTGVATALVLSALGVPREVILADYHLSTQDRSPENEMPPIDPARYPDNALAAFYAKAQANGPSKPRPLYDDQHVAYLQQTFDEIDSRWGSVDAYLDKQLGVGPRDIARLRALYLE